MNPDRAILMAKTTITCGLLAIGLIAGMWVVAALQSTWPQPQPRWLLVQLHTHSTASDGSLSPPEVVALYKDRGYNAVALTDHDVVSAFKSPPGIIVLNGIERTVRDVYGQYHRVEISAGRERFKIVAHPAYNTPMTAEAFTRRMQDADAFEIYNGNVGAADAYVRQGLMAVAVDDMHSPGQAGAGAVFVYSLPDAESIVKALQAGDYYWARPGRVKINPELREQSLDSRV